MNKTFITNMVVLLTLLLMINTMSQQMNPKTNNINIDSLVNEMTLEEKVSLCDGRDDWSTQPIERLNIPWIWLSDGPHGLRRAPATNKAGYGDQIPATCFPTASALAATWDVELINKVGQAIGEECQALNVNILLGPGVNIKRSVLGGRNFEYFSEDPILSGEMGAAFINGVQSQGVGTSLKHFATNNVETERMWANSNVDLRTLNEIYLTPFEIAVRKAHPWTVMACYNRVMGEYGTQSEYLLNQKLRNEWGYEGIVISDWFAIVDRVKALKAGLNIEMPGVSNVNNNKILEAVRNGKIKEEQLNKIVKEILKVVFKAKSLEKPGSKLSSNEHHNFARKVSSESATLLKNDNDILPIIKNKYKSIAVIGEFAERPRFQGNGSSEVKPTQLDNFLDIVESEYSNNFDIKYVRGYNLDDEMDYSLIDKAKEIATNSDIVIILAGLPLQYESEGIDRKHIDIPQVQNQLIQTIASVNKNTVIVLSNGSAVAMPWADKVSSILEMWLGGQAGAGAMADVLFGKVNPSGKLAETFPVKLEDTPAFLNFPAENGDVLYGERVFVGYRYYDKKKIEPLFPFGFGLSYTKFNYSNLKLSSNKITDNDDLKVQFQIENVGNYSGKEVAQIYVSDVRSSVARSIKELKKFVKVELNKGESKTVSIKLNKRDFSYFNPKRNSWVVEPGEFKIMVGASSKNILLTDSVVITSSEKLPPLFNRYTFFREYWENPISKSKIIKLVPNWLKDFIGEGESIENAHIYDFFLDHPIIKLPYISRGEVTLEDIDELINELNTNTQ